MRIRGQDPGVRFPLVGVVAAVAAEARPTTAGPSRPLDSPAPTPRCGAGPVRWPATARLCACAGPQTSTSHRVPALRGSCAGSFSTGAAAAGAKPAPLFLVAWQRSSAPHRSHARGCAASCARQARLPLGILRRLGHRRWHKARLVPASRALVLWLAALRAVAAEVFAAAAGVQVLRINHAPSYNFTL